MIQKRDNHTYFTETNNSLQHSPTITAENLNQKVVFDRCDKSPNERKFTKSVLSPQNRANKRLPISYMKLNIKN